MSPGAVPRETCSHRPGRHCRSSVHRAASARDRSAATRGEGRSLPMSMRHARQRSPRLPVRATAPSLLRAVSSMKISFSVEIELPSTRLCARNTSDVAARCMRRLFLMYAVLVENIHTVDEPLARSARASRSAISASVMSGVSSIRPRMKTSCGSSFNATAGLACEQRSRRCHVTAIPASAVEIPPGAARPPASIDLPL